ncbi:MAG: isoprenylcysteine carboxylmethyltransferase family protein [Ardenticatenaceae bacterium]|nr:isoprenylcysteine carboxylmethyltransferase family protein [Ardenticatenaceae bacterium]
MQATKPKVPTAVLAQMLFFIFVILFLPLLISGHWDWWEAWTYAITGLLGFFISRVLAAKKHPDLLAERARFAQQPDAKSWDKWLAPIVALGGGLIPLAAGLDARFGWSAPFSLPVKLVALLIILAGYALGSYALVANRYFSGMVRIQTERNHHVVSSGPYHWMRHPGYAGALITYLATPFFLDSLWALVPAIIISALLVLRTAWEDETLQAELEGYQAYAQQIRYRLLPGVW